MNFDISRNIREVGVEVSGLNVKTPTGSAPGLLYKSHSSFSSSSDTHSARRVSSKTLMVCAHFNKEISQIY